MMGFIIAIISGTLMSIQGVFNTGVTKQTSVWVTSAFVQLTAFIVCLAIWFITGKEGSFSSLFKIDHKYMLLGGVIGAGITFTVIKSMELLGPARSVMFILIAQMIIAYVIELLGLFGTEKLVFEWKKLIGIALIIIGIITFKWEKS